MVAAGLTVQLEEVVVLGDNDCVVLEMVAETAALEAYGIQAEEEREFGSGIIW